MMARYRLTYDASTRGDNSQVVVWEKTAEELLMPNGTESLLDFMLRETDARGGIFVLERVPESEVAHVLRVVRGMQAAAQGLETSDG